MEEVEDPEMEISVADARLKNKFYDPGDIVHVEIVPKNFGRIAAQKAKQVVVQKIREEERKSLYNEYYGREKVQADRPYQTLHRRSKEHNKGTEGNCISYTS